MAYDGFISYSHAADGRLAPALQAGLQRLGKPWYKPRALRVFRDETGLSTNPHLWSSIVTALDESEWFVLLASPESAQSPWVDREIAHWLETRPADRILPVLTGGGWRWDSDAGRLVGDAVPERLHAAFTEEPRHLDLCWARDETDLDLRNSGFRSAVADLAAPMHGVAKDDLEGEDIRQHRRARRLARAGVATVVVLLVVSVVVAVFAVGQRNQAERATDTALANGLSASSGEFSRSGQSDLALLLGVEANRFADRLGQASPEAKTARYALLGALSAQLKLRGVLSGLPGTLAAASYSPDGRLIVAQSTSGELPRVERRHRPGIGTPADVDHRGVGRSCSHQPRTARDQCRSATTDSDLGPGDEPGLAMAASGWRHPLLGLRVPQTPVALSPGGVLVVGSWVSGAATSSLQLWNINTGQPVSPSLTLSGALDTVAFSPDGTRLAADVISPGGTSFDLALVNVSTGAIERRFAAHPGPAPSRGSNRSSTESCSRPMAGESARSSQTPSVGPSRPSMRQPGRES